MRCQTCWAERGHAHWCAQKDGPNLADEIEELIKQATEERSHFYTASVLRKVQDYIKKSDWECNFRCVLCGEKFKHKCSPQTF